ncbi:unnamed protein product, partial [Prorocentrum cordatum]
AEESTASPPSDGARTRQRPSQRNLNDSYPSRSTLKVADRKRIDFSNGDAYEGGMSSSGDGSGDRRHGHGTYSYASPNSAYKEYSGQWRSGRKHGAGARVQSIVLFFFSSPPRPIAPPPCPGGRLLPYPIACGI